MNGFNGYANYQGYNTGMGGVQPMVYGQPTVPVQPLMTNPLTPEEEKLLITEQDTFDLKVQPKEIAEAVCTHKKDGKFQITPLDDGSCICNLCKARFNPSIVTDQYVNIAVEQILNVVQTCKMIGVDMNNDVVRQFFQIIPYITRIPKLYSMLVRIYDKYNMANPVQPAPGPNAFNVFSNIMNPAVPIGAPAMDPYQMNMMQQNMVYGSSPLYQQPPAMNLPYGVNPAMQGYPQQTVMGQPTFGNVQQQQPPMGQPTMPTQQQTQPPQTGQTSQGQAQQVNVKEQLQL